MSPHGGARDEWEAVRGNDSRSYEQMVGDAAAALVAGLDAVGRDRAVEWWLWGSDEAELDADRSVDEGPCCEQSRLAALAANGWQEDTVDWEALDASYRAEAEADRDKFDGDGDGWVAS